MFLTIAAQLKHPSPSAFPASTFASLQSIPQIAPPVVVLKYKSDHFTFQHQTHQWLPFISRLTSRKPKLYHRPTSPLSFLITTPTLIVTFLLPWGFCIFCSLCLSHFLPHFHTPSFSLNATSSLLVTRLALFSTQHLSEIMFLIYKIVIYFSISKRKQEGPLIIM